MGWRPPEEEWEKLVKENLDWTDRPSLEAGADAMLEVLIKGGCKLSAQNGWWVFIPDEEEKDGRD